MALLERQGPLLAALERELGSVLAPIPRKRSGGHLGHRHRRRVLGAKIHEEFDADRRSEYHRNAPHPGGSPRSRWASRPTSPSPGDPGFPPRLRR